VANNHCKFDYTKSESGFLANLILYVPRVNVFWDTNVYTGNVFFCVLIFMKNICLLGIMSFVTTICLLFVSLMSLMFQWTTIKHSNCHTFAAIFHVTQFWLKSDHLCVHLRKYIFFSTYKQWQHNKTISNIMGTKLPWHISIERSNNGVLPLVPLFMELPI